MLNNVNTTYNVFIKTTNYIIYHILLSRDAALFTKIIVVCLHVCANIILTSKHQFTNIYQYIIIFHTSILKLNIYTVRFTKFKRANLKTSLP